MTARDGTNPDTLDQFRIRLAENPALCDRLAVFEDRDAFVAAAADLGTEIGLVLDRQALAAALRPDPLGLDRFDDLAANRLGWPAPGWLPVALVSAVGEWAIDWMHFGGARLVEPFFEDSVRTARRRPINRLLRWRTPLSVLMQPPPADAAGVPDGLIFHMSRCGSTLVAQMLAASPDHVVVSEAAVFDQVVQMAHVSSGLPLDQRLGLLRGMLSALGRRAGPDKGRFFVKLDSWHMLAFPLLRDAFPQTPWLFLYREPVEILVSQARMPGLQVVPGALGDLYGLGDGRGLAPGEYAACALARIGAAALEQQDQPGGLFVDYGELPEALERRILPHFHVRPDPEALGRMREVAARDSKTPALPFVDDRQAKRDAATAAIRGFADRHLSELHRSFGARSARTAAEAVREGTP